MKQLFIEGEKIGKDLMDKYQSILPEKLLDIWREYGFGELLDGYLRIINPDDYQQLIKDTYFRGNISIPIFVTAFGDVITYEEGGYIGMVKYKHGSFNIISKGIPLFFAALSDNHYLAEYFQLPMYDSAVKLLGKPGYDECYGFVPLLGLGGKEDVANLKIVKTREHIALITKLLGNVGM